MRFAAAFAALLLGSTSLFAQSIGGNTSLSVSGSSAAVQLPTSTSSAPAVMITPAPGASATEIFYAFGASSVAATTSSASLPVGGICFNNVGKNNYLAAIATGGTATLRITQMPYCPPIFQGASGAGGGSSGNATIISPLSSSTLDAASVSVTFGGTSPAGYVSPCTGAVGAKGALECLINIANSGSATFGSALPTVGLAIGMSYGGNLVAVPGTANGLKVDPSGVTQPVSLQASATGGATGGHILSAASNNAANIKSSPGMLYSLSWIQTTTTLMDIRLYDTSGTPTCSSSAGVVLNIPAQSNTSSPGGALTWPNGIAFLTGIGICITGANADNDNTNATTGLNVNYTFR